MSKRITINNYVFDATARTVTFSSFTSIELDKVLLITNVTQNVIIYNFVDPLKGGNVVNNVLTLDYDTTSMSNVDDLQIFYRHDGYKTLIRENSGNPDIVYVGLAEPGTSTAAATWQIKRLTLNNNDLDVEMADSNYDFDNVYDNRESLAYG